MKDINTVYRDAVAAANAEQRTMLAEASKTFVEATKLYMERVEAAATQHLAAVSAAEIAWRAASEVKLAQFEGDDEKAPVELPRIDPKELKEFENHVRGTDLSARQGTDKTPLPAVQLFQRALDAHEADAAKTEEGILR